MILDIVKCGHPALREQGRRIERVTPELRQLVADMIETMYAANGVGLAAQQVGRALLLTVLDVSPTEIPWTMSPRLPMPLVLLNPVLSDLHGEQIGQEGCLSVPEVAADIRRAEQVTVTAQNLDLQPVTFTCTGLLARAVQHEVDHLHGILFLERMDAATRASFAGKIKKLQKETLAALASHRRRAATIL